MRFQLRFQLRFQVRFQVDFRIGGKGFGQGKGAGDRPKEEAGGGDKSKGSETPRKVSGRDQGRAAG